MSGGPSEAASRQSFAQRQTLRMLRRKAGKRPGEALSEEDWRALWELNETAASRYVHWMLRALPGHQRCGMCSAPFAGPGSAIARPLGYRPSRKNPTLCAVCVEASPPGGATMETGVLFADLRDFTSRSEGASPSEVSVLLNRFYGCAEDVLFPEAIIDKLIGDEVMALYLPQVNPAYDEAGFKALMLDHARALLKAVGYGSPEGPFVELGIGIDYGEAYVGNVGDRAVYDFTALGDVVNTASRLQGQAQGGEVICSERIAAGLSESPGAPVQLTLKGKAEPVSAFRSRVD